MAGCGAVQDRATCSLSLSRRAREGSRLPPSIVQLPAGSGSLWRRPALSASRCRLFIGSRPWRSWSGVGALLTCMLCVLAVAVISSRALWYNQRSRRHDRG
jgi:hypothetical protein